MADLTTQYMGFTLDNPIIVGSSGLTDSPSKVANLASNGASAVVLKSIFEEQIMMEVDAQGVNNMYGSYPETEGYVSFYTKKHNLDEYTRLIRDSKNEADIPIIASVNCISSGDWVEYAKTIQNAGADALELNVFILPGDPEFTSEQIEQVYFDVANKVTALIDIPVAMKVSSFFSSMSRTLIDLSKTDIQGMVMFNRFYSPDIDLNKEKVVSGHIYSVPEDNAQCLRWAGMLHGKMSCDIACSNGIHNGEAALKNILVGADAVEIASALYKNGASYIKTMLEDMNSWLDKKGYKSIQEIRGKLSQQAIKKPMIYERAQFMKYFSEHR